MKELLIKLLLKVVASDGFDLIDALSLDKALRSYHKSAAKSRGLKVNKGGWFLDFAVEFPQVELQRSAVDIIKELFMAGAKGKHGLPEIYFDALKDLLLKLQS